EPLDLPSCPEEITSGLPVRFVCHAQKIKYAKNKVWFIGHEYGSHPHLDREVLCLPLNVGSSTLNYFAL
ncbi:hypothetical protein AVEN_125007-1, partial [Araneus ventricosus]